MDTNVLLSGLLGRGACEELLDRCFIDCTVILSLHILEEFDRISQSKFNVSQAGRNAALRFLRARAELVEPVALPADACRDPDDLPILGTLAASDADCLVTGDADLLALGAFRGKPIVSPRQFHAMLMK